ncbi:CGG triplet repeat-binding protein 1 [Labeo rohita]|uniref:CGG triplet repeat-binding protein 1 n=1 Tax=Labeo rohita TaxID=84645 RepID=A0ABQ8LYW0_LABRO|nr:CGG triplet repeat-binding protein 1 [Labeo rohita]
MSANTSHLPTNITAKDSAKQNVLHESGGKLFCTVCNIIVEHKRKSSLDRHFSTAKHARRMSVQEPTRQQFPNVLHESGGKLFCTVCNIIVEHKRKSSLDRHFSTAKHARRMSVQEPTRQVTITEAVARKSIASSETTKKQTSCQAGLAWAKGSFINHLFQCFPYIDLAVAPRQQNAKSLNILRGQHDFFLIEPALQPPEEAAVVCCQICM